MAEIRIDSAAEGWGQTLGIEARYAGLVERLAIGAASNPEAYRRRVTAAGLLGYVVIGTVLALLIALGGFVLYELFTGADGAALWIKLAIVTGLTVFGVIRALSLPKVEPEGRVLSQGEAPALFALVERVRAIADGPRIDELRLIDDLNASVTQEPTFGPFGNISRLYIGLPLLRALSAAEAEAVIAHEFGHFAKRHGRSASFIYRIRMRWARIADELPDGIVASAFRKFFRWYAPWFAAYSFTLARQQEYDADAVAAKAAGTRAIGDALKRIEMQAAQSEHGWTAIWQDSFEGQPMPSAPSETIARRFLTSGATGDGDGAAAKALTAAIKRSPGLDDTHPTLSQRLTALGEDSAPPPALERSAADDLLGEETAAALAAEFDREWIDACGSRWAEMAEIRRDQIIERDLLLNKDPDRLPLNDLERLAVLESDIDGAEGALRGYRRLLDRDPEDGIAAFHAGVALASLDRPEAVELFDVACRNEPQVAPIACGMAIELLDRIDRPQQAREFESRLVALEASAEAARVESAVLSDKALIEPIAESLCTQVCAAIDPIEGLARVLGGQRVREHSARPQLIVLFKAERGASGELLAESLVGALNAFGDVLVLEESFDRRWLKRRLSRMQGTSLFGRA